MFIHYLCLCLHVYLIKMSIFVHSVVYICIMLNVYIHWVLYSIAM